ncbi:hypothetical protein KXQ82_01225 [Mucilaginibacter sp. HMF5004]|uniref:glutamate--tRNA ligase family protein n=1 Tax=Mucilaginibacter rivuli TaxID=2857527 RepID=UPI001C5E032D|nr:glutamate--tRNA ligase family protein [Mucilaginibacter rivuli]MBW4888310.1 hypothetical protein [Mucilaginibacter rivuli]
MQQAKAIFNKTRIAPTPSGFLHLGNALSFAITAALAHKTGAKILLRIDDLDQARMRSEYVQDIFDTLNFLEISWHEGPRDMGDFNKHWSQVQRLGLYNNALNRLKQSNSIFACSCSRADIPESGIYPGTCLNKGLPLDTPNTSWRFKTDSNPIAVRTFPSGIVNSRLSPDMRYFIVRKRDGYPAYQLASLVDDLHFGIDLIIRGQDLWPSTLAQLQLANRLDENAFVNTNFYHHPLLMADGNKKLSKSAGDTSIKYLIEQGKNAADIYTMIAAHTGEEQRVNNWLELSHLLGS